MIPTNVSNNKEQTDRHDSSRQRRRQKNQRHGGCTKPGRCAQRQKETTSEKEKKKRNVGLLKNVCVFPELIWKNSEAAKQQVLPLHKRADALI